MSTDYHEMSTFRGGYTVNMSNKQIKEFYNENVDWWNRTLGNVPLNEFEETAIKKFKKEKYDIFQYNLNEIKRYLDAGSRGGVEEIKKLNMGKEAISRTRRFLGNDISDILDANWGLGIQRWLSEDQYKNMSFGGFLDFFNSAPPPAPAPARAPVYTPPLPNIITSAEWFSELAQNNIMNETKVKNMKKYQEILEDFLRMGSTSGLRSSHKALETTINAMNSNEQKSLLDSVRNAMNWISENNET